MLGIETSCDETSAAVVDASAKGITVRSNVVSSQIKLHAKWGGVVPHLAAREHTKNIDHVLNLALKEAKADMKKIDLVAVTSGPGLIGSLMIGTLFAKALAWKHSKPLLGINHMEGHIYSNWLKPVAKSKAQISNVKNEIKFPTLCLIVSGGHTQLVLMPGHGKYKLVGETLDDAAGEAFDKIARILGLSYPGGPAISKSAKNGNPAAFILPRPMIHHKNYDFSFSGLKTSVLYLVRDLVKETKKLSPKTKHDIAASTQAAIVDVLVAKTIKAAKQYKAKAIMLSGGVSANELLRSQLHNAATELGVAYFQPPREYTTDNAAMIAVAGYFNFLRNKKARLDWRTVSADPNWEIF